jgi:hypothetical protein
MTKFQAINKTLKISKGEYKDLVVVVFKEENKTFSFCLESVYTGDDDKIIGRYLNGSLAPT